MIFFFFLLCFTCCHVFFFFMYCAINGKKALKDRQSILYRPWALSNLAQPQGSKPFYLLPQIISRTSCFVPSGSSGSIDTLWTVLFVILFFVISWSLRPDVYFVKQQWKQEVFGHWVFFLRHALGQMYFENNKLGYMWIQKKKENESNILSTLSFLAVNWFIYSLMVSRWFWTGNLQIQNRICCRASASR